MPSITKFYSGRTILVTGGTGFMGKVLLEKMIRSLPDVEKIYVLLREKKGISPDARIRAITSTVPFTLHDFDPEHLKKLVPIHADVTKNNLSLSEDDEQKIINEVSVVFHLAASIRMDLSLKDAIIQNTLGTQRVMNLCTKIKKLDAVVHLSTAYCNVDVEYMEEKVYKVKLDPYKVIDMVQWMDDESLEAVQESIIKPHPNTYTYTKRLAEIVACDMGKKLPVTIGRPSIVIPSYKEPVPGWVDNFNGPTGLLAAAGKGVVRTVLADKDLCPQVIPVDLAINALLIMACIRATENFSETPIYNLTQGDIVQMTWNQAVEKFRVMAFNNPFEKMLWYPRGGPTKYVLWHKLQVLLFHMIPAYIVDFLMIIFLQKPFLVGIQNRLNTGLKLLAYFALRQFTFTNENTKKLYTQIEPSEADIFPVTNVIPDIDKYLTDAFYGTKQFCFKESPQSNWRSKALLKFLYLLDLSIKLVVFYALLRWFLSTLGLADIMTWNYWIDIYNGH